MGGWDHTLSYCLEEYLLLLVSSILVNLGWSLKYQDTKEGRKLISSLDCFRLLNYFI